jgi:phage terminase Nu1 subunit (DNA packaging protein)
VQRQELAAALDLDVRTLQRYLERGMPEPTEGETLDAWKARAEKWRTANRHAPGPKPRSKTSALDKAELRKKQAEAKLRELDLAERQGKLHSVPECHDLQVGRYQELAAAFAGFARAMKHRVHLVPPDEVEQILDDEVRRRLEIVAPRAPQGAAVDAGTA